MAELFNKNLKTKEQKITIKKRDIKTGESFQRIKIKVIGIGGGGSSIVSEIAPKIKKVSFTVANVDSQALKQVPREVKCFQFGKELTHGLGCGMDPDLGRRSAEECKERINKELDNCDLCIFVACLGGGTGSGAGPVFAEVARNLKKKSFGIFTLPFSFEGEKRSEIAKESLEKIKHSLNAFTVIPNDRIFQIIDEKTPLKKSLSAVNKILSQNLEGLIEMIYAPGIINIDFADLKTVLDGRGKLAYLSSIESQGSNRAADALNKILHNPLNKYNIRAKTADASKETNSFLADRVLFNIAASKDLAMSEVEQVSKTISDFNKFAKIIFGVSENGKYKDRIRITLLAVGSEKNRKVVLAETLPVLSQKVISSDKKPRAKKKKMEKNISRSEQALRKRSKDSKKRDGKKRLREVPKPRRKTPKGRESDVEKEGKEKTGADNQEKEVVSVPAKIKSSGSSVPLLLKPKRRIQNKFSTPKRIRRNALELKKELEQTEKEILEEERKWDIPAFLRRKQAKS